MTQRKPPERRQRRNQPPAVAVAQRDVDHVPPPAKAWLKETQAAWVTFWRDGVSQVVQRTDEPSLRRLFELYDTRSRIWDEFVKQPYVRGSRGQPRLNPLGPFALNLDGQIQRIERAFGITPAARVTLGIQFSAAKRSLEELAREAHDKARGT